MNQTTQHLFKSLIKSHYFKQQVLDDVSSEGTESISLLSENNVYRFCKTNYGTLSDNIEWTELMVQLVRYKYPNLWKQEMNAETSNMNTILEAELKQQFMSMKAEKSATNKKHYFNEYRIRKFVQSKRFITTGIQYEHLLYIHYKQMAKHQASNVTHYVGVKFDSSKIYYYLYTGIIHTGDIVKVDAAGTKKEVMICDIRSICPNPSIRYKHILQVVSRAEREVRTPPEMFMDFAKGINTNKMYTFQQQMLNRIMRDKVDTVQIIHDEVLIKETQDHVVDAYAYMAEQMKKEKIIVDISRSTKTGRISGLNLTPHQIPKQKENIMDDNAKCAGAEIEQHTYNSRGYEERAFYNNRDLTHMNDNTLLNTMVALKEKIHKLKDLATSLKSDKLKKQLKRAKSDLNSIKAYYEAR